MEKRRNRRFVIVFQVLVLTFFCARCLALRDSIGDITVPPSSVQRGLVKTPNPIDTSSNLAVTGNVSGVAYFHGLVPYRSTTEFGASMGTEDISSFLRRSAPINLTRSQLTPQPYYLPSSTVSSIIPGSRGVMSTYSNISGSAGTNELAAGGTSKIEKRTEIPAASPLYDYDRTRPLSYEPTDLERVITYDRIREKNKEELSAALQRAGGDVHKIGDESQTSEQLTKNPTNLISEPTKPVERFEPVKPAIPGQQPTVKTEKIIYKSVYEQMLQQVAENQQGQEVQSEQKQPDSGREQPQKSAEKEPVDLKSELSGIDKETSEAVVGVHKSFATEMDDKFNYYMRIAEKFLKQGKYYRATDAYTLASVYKPQDPLAYAGRSHTLFASGEYMSSAYFLARAIDIFPQYVSFRIDLNAMIPDKDRLESRIEDVKQWIDSTGSAELSFLLAYIYYQLDKPNLATGAIEFAQEKIPDSSAVKVLKDAIEGKR